MAEARLITVTPKPVELEKFVQLNLTMQEAMILFTIFHHISGDMKKSFRKNTDDIAAALEDMFGIDRLESYKKVSCKISGSLNFS